MVVLLPVRAFVLALEIQVLALRDDVEVRAHERHARRLRAVLLRVAKVKARVARRARLHALVHAPALRSVRGVHDRRDRRARQEVVRSAVLPAPERHGRGVDDVQPRPESRFGIDVNRQRRVIPRLALEARGARLGERVEVRRHGGRAETRAGESRRGRASTSIEIRRLGGARPGRASRGEWWRIARSHGQSGSFILDTVSRTLTGERRASRAHTVDGREKTIESGDDDANETTAQYIL